MGMLPTLALLLVAAVEAALAPPELAPITTASSELAPPALAIAAGAALAPLCPTGDETCCQYTGFSGHEHFYTLRNSSEFLVLYSGAELVLKCRDSEISLNDACMPRFSSTLAIGRVTLAGCLPGSGETLTGTLRALGVRPASLRQLELHLPLDTTVSSELLGETDELAALQMLALIAPSDSSVNLSVAAAAALERLPALTSLHVSGVRLPTNASLPRTLQTLRQEGTVAELSRQQLEQLPALEALALRDTELRKPPPLFAARALRSATIEGPLDGLPELLNVENITFRGAASLQWRGGGCGALRRLRVSGGPAPGGPAPARWLARCPRLHALALTARGLTALPADLFDYTPDLRALDVSANKLTFLDSAMLQRVPRLEELVVSRNALSAGALAALSALPALRNLVLDGNPLGDLCPQDTKHLTVPVLSPLAGLTSLRRLSLAATGARRVCGDWPRRLPALRALGLQRNNITQLQEKDLQWTAREGGAAVLDARGNPLRSLRMRRADYALLPEEPQPVNVIVLVDSALQCDCAAYWLVRALRARRLPAALRARCGPAAGRAAVGVQHVPLQDMTCPLEEGEGCPAGCACRWGAHDNATAVACARAARLPDTRALPLAALRLSVSSGRLDTLPADLPDNLVMLDVSGNNISHVPPAASTALVELLARGRRVRLARNPLRCACADRALLRALAERHAQVEDYADVKCSDGRWVGDAELQAWLEACGAWRGAAAAAGALLAAGAALVLGAALLLRRSALARLKAREVARALCPAFCLDSDPDDDSEYDVFLSFAHGDREVAEHVVAALERGGQRVCLHSRDWRAGDFIPAQIAHSVAVSRRTVVLLSERFARSRWARAELRLAAARALRDARPRLLVVLLGAAPPALDAELARYVAAHTYLSYADPRFWDKLRRAVAAPTRPPRAKDHSRDLTDVVDTPADLPKKPPEFTAKTVPPCA